MRYCREGDWPANHPAVGPNSALQLTSLPSACPQAVVAKKRGMNPGAQAKANKAAQAVKGQTLKAMTNKCVGACPSAEGVASAQR